MTFSLVWLPEVLEQAGLKVAEVPGWRTRGRAEMGTVRGVMCHHTATAAAGNMPTLNMLINGRSDLPGPLAQLGLGRDGTVYIVAAGRANHAGPGVWETIATGNSSFIGIEAENNGTTEIWPPIQLDAYKRAAAAILKKIGANANMCCGHKEYATPPGRKSDPDFDMPSFRRDVAAFLVGKTPDPPIPHSDDNKRLTLRRGDVKPEVAELQTLLRIEVTGTFDGATEAALRSAQRAAGLVPDGICGPKSWQALAPLDPAPAPPPRPLLQGNQNPGAIAPAALIAGAAPAAELPPADDENHRPRPNGTAAIGPDGKGFANRRNQGFQTNGETTLGAWLKTHQQPGASDSVRRVLNAVSVNEGCLEAVNSYDNAHMSFGVFQWTAGAADGDPGELPGLLKRIKLADAAAFKACFGDFGLDVANKGQKVFLTLNGARLETAQSKEVLRDIVWAYRFWRAGHHDVVRSCQFALAASRIDAFFNVTAAGKPLNVWLSSEYAIALILDEHVNRPGHVPKTLETAIAATGPLDPTAFSDQDEHDLIDAYLDARAAPAPMRMTASDKRADAIRSFVQKGLLSDARGSFKRQV